jgi:GTP-binding protein
MGIASNGDYGIPKDVMFGFPVTTKDGKYEVVKGLDIDAFSQERINKTLKELEDERKNLDPLFQLIVDDVPPPKPQKLAGEEHPFKMLVTTLEADNFLGRILTGRIESGVITTNRNIKALNRDGETIEKTRVTKLLAFRGLARVPVERAEAGDIVAIAGLENATVADTLCDLTVNEPIPSHPIDPPTLAMTISVNDSPYAGREGDKVQSRVIRERLLREAEGNVALKVAETGDGDFEVAGRGELQLGVLIESMRREGFELSISRPRVLFKTIDGEKMEPIEEVTVDVDDELRHFTQAVNFGTLHAHHLFELALHGFGGFAQHV